MNIEDKTAIEAREFLNELLAERSWHKQEPRCGYRRNYERLESLVEDFSQQIEKQLPTVEEIQEIYRKILNP